MLTQSTNLRTGETLWVSLPKQRIRHEKLSKHEKADVVIIGAGVTGAMAAEALTAKGLSVIILDRRGPLKGSTSATTALLQYEIDTPLTKLSRQIGKTHAVRAWRRSKLALESLKAIIQSLDIDCEMREFPSLYLNGNVLNAEALKEEADARNQAGLFCEYMARGALKEEYGIARAACVRSYGNITVNPLAMSAGFLKAALSRGARIFAPVIAQDIQCKAQGVRVLTDSGYHIDAKYLIYATGYEIPHAIHSRRISVHSTYAIATRPQKQNLWPSQAMIWEAADPYLYLRTTADGRIICGGADEEFKNEEKRDALLARKTASLEKKLKQLFSHVDSKAEFAWTGSFGQSTTGLPLIGELPGMSGCYAILSYGGNGITFSRLAAEILSNELCGIKDQDRDLFAFNETDVRLHSARVPA